MAAPAAAADAATKEIAPFYEPLANLDKVNYAEQVVINAKALNKKGWDAKGEKYFILRDPLADYKEGMTEPPPPPPPLAADPNVPDFFIAFPRKRICEVSEHINRLVSIFEAAEQHRPVVIAEVAPEALVLFAEFCKNHATDKLKEIPKPMRDHVRTYLTEADKAWVAKWVNFDDHYDNWTLFRMVDTAEVLMYEDFSTMVSAVLGECLKDKKISELRRFFHEKDPHGGFTPAEEKSLMKQCRESWPESKHLFDVAMDE